MECHCGRCYSHSFYFWRCCMIYGWCYNISGIWNDHCIRMFILSSGMLNRTLCHTCGNVFVKKWIVDPYVYQFLHSPSEVLVLHPYYTEVSYCSNMTCDVSVVIYWRGPWGVLWITPKWSWGFSNIFLITLHLNLYITHYYLVM